MAVTKDDFEKIWASQSPLTPYSFSDSQYKEGWNFVGSTPPSRQMWDAFMQTADEKLKYLYQHEDVPIGHEYFTFNPNIPQGSLPLFGGEYDRETYSDLWNWVQQQTGYLKTEAEWQTLSASNNGNVPYYSSGDGSTTFRVPSLKCWVKGANGTVTEVGSYLEAGLPNITGGVNPAIAFDSSGSLASLGVASSSGAFGSETQQKLRYFTSAGLSTNNKDAGITFDASNSNSIYGNSTTVQPPSIVGMWLVKAYGVIVDTGTIDEQAYIDDRFNASKQYTDDKIAPIGNIVADSLSSSVSYSSAEKTILTITLSKGIWVVTGHARFTGTVASKIYGVSLSDVVDIVNSAIDGSMLIHATISSLSLALDVTRIVNMTNDGMYYLNAFSNDNYTVANADIKAVRII